MNPRITAVSVPTNPRVQLARTVKLIGQGIRAGAEYQPLRLHAARVATTAARKDYGGQLQAIYNDFLKRWRYVRDPIGIETVATSGPALWGVVWGAYNPGGKGWGDCDDATAALGAAAQAIGLPVRIVTMSQPGTAQQSHVYPEIQIPGRGWIPADPVAHPLPMGGAPPAGVRIRWNLNGEQLGASMSQYSGYVNNMNGLGYQSAYPAAYPEPAIDGLAGMYQPAYVEPYAAAGLGATADQGWQGADLDVYGLAGTDGGTPDDMIEVLGIGAYVEPMGMLGGGACMAEVEPETADGYAMTPLLEVGLTDYGYLQENGAPYEGMGATDAFTGDYYRWTTDGLGRSFFRRLFKRVRKGIRKIGKKIKKGAKWLIKKIPGGKYLMKFGKKLKKIAMKMVKPLAKLVGKAAPFLAKVAAFIPGYGPAIAAGLHTAGRIAKVMNKVGVTKKKGKLSFKSGAQMKAFKKELKREARAAKMQKQGTAGLGAWGYGKGVMPPPKMLRRLRRMKRKMRRARRMATV